MTILLSRTLPFVFVRLSLLFLLFFGGRFCAAETPPDVVERGRQATVLVEVGNQAAYGTAFCIDPAGFFITNAHVVADTPGPIRLIALSGTARQRILIAKIAHLNREADLALLKAEVPDAFPSLALGEVSGLRETQDVTAFGYPFGRELVEGVSSYPTISVSPGHITALRKARDVLQNIQLDASLNPGNSGGPVLDAKGQVIGIVQSGIPGASVNFAIPITRLNLVMDKVALTFLPPVITAQNLHTEQTFVIRAEEVMGALHPGSAPVALELILNAAGDARAFRALPDTPHTFVTSAAPVPRFPLHMPLCLVLQRVSGSVIYYVEDQDITVHNTRLRLRDVQRIQFGADAGVTRNDGQVERGHIAEWGKLITGQANSHVLPPKDALEATVRAVDRTPQSVFYRIVAKRGDKVVGELVGAIEIAGLPAQPAGIAAAMTDSNKLPLGPELFVCNFGKSRIVRFEALSGRFLDDFVLGREMNDPHQMLFGPDGNLYIANQEAISRFNGRTGAYLDDFVLPKSGNLRDAAGMAFGPDGNLYVGDAATGAVKRYDGKTGKYLSEFATNSIAAPKVGMGLVFSPDGRLYITYHKVQCYDPVTGMLLREIKDDDLTDAGDLAFGFDGSLYVCNPYRDEVRRYDGATGAYLDTFVDRHSGGLKNPAGLAFGPDGSLYVSSNVGNRILRYNGKTGAYIGDFAPDTKLSMPGYLLFCTRNGN